MDHHETMATAESADEATAMADEDNQTSEHEEPEEAPRMEAPAAIESTVQPDALGLAEEQPARSGPAPAAEHAPTEDQAPAAEHAPTTEEAPTEELAPAAEHAPTTEEAPTEELAPAAEEPPIEEQAPAAEHAPAAEPRSARSEPRSRPVAAYEHPRTKLVCTIGPASAERVRELVEAGMDVARINFSHGTPDQHKHAVDAVRSAAHAARRSVAVMVDLPGAKIRLGEIGGGRAELEVGRPFVLRQAAGEGSAEGASVSTAGLSAAVRAGDRVLLADGAVELRVTAGVGGDIHTEVVRGGGVRSGSGVNIPTERLTGPRLTDADREAIPRALQLKADLIAQSFVASGQDVRDLRALLGDGPAAPAVVAKIETRAAVDDFDDILDASDGVMVARGDLGVDLPFEDIPLIQKMLLRRARDQGRCAIVATQMLESMTNAARPTRAEASDVANAVLDGTDAVMLSAETAIGDFPVEAARAAISICSATERDVAGTLSVPYARLPDTPAEAVVHAAVELSLRYPPASAIWCFTRSGRTAEMLSSLRPRLPIVAFTTSPQVARRLAVRSGLMPVVLPVARTGEPLVNRMESAARSQGVMRLAADGEQATVLLMTTSDQPRGINRLELHEV